MSSQEDILNLAKLETRAQILSEDNVGVVQYAKLLKNSIEMLTTDLAVNQLITNEMKDVDITKMTDDQRKEFSEKNAERIKKIIKGEEKIKISKDVASATTAMHIAKLEKEGGNIYKNTKAVSNLALKTAAYDKKMELTYGGKYKIAKKLAVTGTAALVGQPGLIALAAYNAGKVVDNTNKEAKTQNKSILGYINDNPTAGASMLASGIGVVASACMGIDGAEAISFYSKIAGSAGVGLTASAENIAKGQYKEAAKVFGLTSLVASAGIVLREYGDDITKWLGNKLGLGGGEVIQGAKSSSEPVIKPEEQVQEQVMNPKYEPLAQEQVVNPENIYDTGYLPEVEVTAKGPDINRNIAGVDVHGGSSNISGQEVYDGINQELDGYKPLGEEKDFFFQETENTIGDGKIKTVDLSDGSALNEQSAFFQEVKLAGGYKYEVLENSGDVAGNNFVNQIIRPDGSSIDLSPVSKDFDKYIENTMALSDKPKDISYYEGLGLSGKQANREFLNQLNSRATTNTENSMLYMRILGKLGIKLDSPDAKAISGIADYYSKNQSEFSSNISSNSKSISGVPLNKIMDASKGGR